MYLAGLMADETKITREQLEEWVDQAYWYYLSEFTVPFVAAETEFGFELGNKWIASDKEGTASAGWATLAFYARLYKNLDIEAYSKLLDDAEKNILTSPNRVRYTMNGFVIATGTFISELTGKALIVAEKIGKVTVDMGGTSCKVPLAKEHIQKAIAQGIVGKKRKSARC
jgi:hypothetical protein